MIRRLLQIVVGSALLAAVGAGIYVGIKAAYGGFGDYYYVTARLPRAGQQVQIGTDVRVRGVNIGKVSDLRLDNRDAVLTLQIEADHEVPRTAQLVISLKTFLGEKFVDLRFDPRVPAEPLEDGDALADAHVAPELEDALDDGTRLLDAVDADELASVVHELAVAGRGHADDIARALRAQARLTSTFAATLEPQVEAVRHFDALFEELDDVGDEVNALVEATNEGAPVYASEQAQRALGKALDTLVPFADSVSDILLEERENLDVMYRAGDRVLQAVASNSQGLSRLLYGAYQYVFRLGHAPVLFFDISAQAAFTNFIGGDDQEEDFRQLCAAIPPEHRDEVAICKDARR